MSFEVKMQTTFRSFSFALVFLFPWHFPVSWFVFDICCWCSENFFRSAQHQHQQEIRTRKTVFVVLKNVKNSRFVCLPKDMLWKFKFFFLFHSPLRNILHRKTVCLLQWNNAKTFPTIFVFSPRFFLSLWTIRHILCFLTKKRKMFIIL